MTKHLPGALPSQPGARPKHRHKSWSTERRARQSALIGRWSPWRHSTGPKTDAGKARCAMNALKHGFRSQATIREFQRVRYAIRLAAWNNERLRLYIRLRDGRPRIKYKPLPSEPNLAHKSQIRPPPTPGGRSRRRPGGECSNIQQHQERASPGRAGFGARPAGLQ